jgi:hypothetical protein
VAPAIVNEALFAASADRVKIAVQTEGDRYKRSIYGISYPYLFPEKEIFDKVPTIEIQNFATIDGGPYPSASSGPIWQFSDNLTWIKSSHTFKFGGYWERSGQNDFDRSTCPAFRAARIIRTAGWCSTTLVRMGPGCRSRMRLSACMTRTRNSATDPTSPIEVT